MKRTRIRIAVALAAVGALAVAAVAWAAPANISTGPYQVPVTAQFEMTAKVCDNKTSVIDLSGGLTFPGVGVEVRFENQDNNTTKGKGWKKSDVASTAAMSVYELEDTPLAKQPVDGGVGGNPYIWIQLKSDASGANLGDAILLGRCVMGNSYKTGKYTNYVDADAEAVLSTLGCDQSGAFVDVGAAGAHDGVDATVFFTNNRKGTHLATTDAKVQLNLTEPIHARKGGRLDGGNVTGNPLISAHFIDHNGTQLQDFIALGRCNQLGA